MNLLTDWGGSRRTCNRTCSSGRSGCARGTAGSRRSRGSLGIDKFNGSNHRSILFAKIGCTRAHTKGYQLQILRVGSCRRSIHDLNRISLIFISSGGLQPNTATQSGGSTKELHTSIKGTPCIIKISTCNDLNGLSCGCNCGSRNRCRIGCWQTDLNATAYILAVIDRCESRGRSGGSRNRTRSSRGSRGSCGSGRSRNSRRTRRTDLTARQLKPYDSCTTISVVRGTKGSGIRKSTHSIGCSAHRGQNDRASARGGY